MNRSTQKSNIFIRFLLGWGILALLTVFMNPTYSIPTEWELKARYVLLAVLCCFNLLLFFKKNLPEYIGFIYFPILFFVSIELISRPILTNVLNETGQRELFKLKTWTYPINQSYIGHPFTQYSGNPNVVEGTKYNNYGFVGTDFTKEKPVNVIRIAALGGSTTERGYPKLLENYLNEKKQIDSLEFEVYNFGLSGWTTAHSLTNFLLNVVDFQPNVVIIHHAWNDVLIRNTDPKHFRNDYAHVYKSFEAPTVYDRYLLRSSMLYRYIKWVINKRPSSSALETAMLIDPKSYINTEEFSNLEELFPFQRNIQSIIDHAQLNGAEVILSTQPHSSDSTVPLFQSAQHIDQCNELLRKIAASDSSCAFVDLDAQLTGKKNDFFIDLGHMTEEGIEYKAEEFGKVILGQFSFN